MDVARIRLNETCNLRCAYCNERRDAETPSFVAAGAVKARIDEALKSGAKELVLTGGEPTLRKDLQQIINYVADAGVRVVLETNATQDVSVARVSVVRVHVPLWDGAIVRGIEKLDASEASVPLIKSNQGKRSELISELKAHTKIRSIVAVIPINAPDSSELLSLEDAGRALEELDTVCRHEGFTLRLAGGTPLPPCQVEKPTRLAHLFSLTRGGAQRPDFTHASQCSECVLKDLCPGLPNGVRATARAITDERLRRKLSNAGTIEQQIDRELITRDVRRVGSRMVRENIVRVNFRCNQACTFCFVSTHLPSAKEEAIEAGIVEVARLGGVVTLSGGEPTLNPRLREYVELAKREGASEVELQTNATKLNDRALTESLVNAGVDVAFVSLHGSRAAVSDVVTEAPGTFEKTVLGLDELHRTKVTLRINFVFCQTNAEDFPAFVELVTTRWPRAAINVSFVAPSTDVVPREAKLIPRYSDVQQPLAAGLALATQRGTTIIGFDSMCGMPFCLVPAQVRAQFATLRAAPDDRGEFVKTAACAQCSMQTQCYGLRRGYAELHGTDELRSVREAP
ncbi:MAG: radical SAM protein [Archangium sp.]|nr:radical SAM protein [Archangium sp.]